MKVKKEDLKKLINILEELYNKGDKVIDITNSFNIPKYKEDFTIPDNWYLSKTDNEHYWEILAKWIKIKGNVLGGHPQGKDWEIEYPSKYVCSYSETKYFVGGNVLNHEFKEITWEQFEEYIYNKK